MHAKATEKKGSDSGKTKADAPLLRPVRKARVSDEAVVQLTNLILNGAVSVGEKLPPERELARQLSINRTSLREALRRMEAMGLVRIRPGDGIFVQDHAIASGIEFLRFLLSAGIGLDKELILSIAEVRRIFGAQMMALAAERADPQSLAALDRILEQYPRDDPAKRDSGESDFAFYHEIARATGNKVFVYLLNTIRDVLQQLSGFYFRVQGDPGAALALYRGIVDAMRDRDGERAAAIFLAQTERDDDALKEALEGMK